MVDWKDLSFQLVLAVIGSSLLGFVITNLYSSYTQPRINIDVFEPPQPPQIRDRTLYQVKFTNEGLTSAQNLRLSMLFNQNLIQNATILASENVTWTQENGWSGQPPSVIIYAPRLSPNAAISADVEISSSQPQYYFTATYGQNTNYRTNAEESPGSGAPRIARIAITSISPNTIGLIVATILSFISFLALAIRRSKRYQPFRYRKEPDVLVSNIISDIITVRNALSNETADRTVKRIFLFDTWESKETAYKRTILDNFEDYQLVDKFYDTVEERDTLLLQKAIDHDLVTEYNKECSRLVNEATANIDWKKYQTENHKKLDLVFTASTIIFGSFVINILRDMAMRVLFSDENKRDLINLIGRIPVDILTVFVGDLIRGSIVFLIMLGVVKFRSSYFRVISIKDANTFSPFLSRHELIKLFGLSFAVMLIPVGPFIEGSVIDKLEGFAFSVSFITMIKMYGLLLIITKIGLGTKLSSYLLIALFGVSAFLFFIVMQ